MQKKKIYLAGAIEAAPDGGATWRTKVTPLLNKLGYSVFNPCVETDGKLAEKLGWETFSIEKWRDLKENQPHLLQDIARWIVNQDLEAVTDSDILLVYFDKYVTQGAGTYGEITVARYTDMPVYIVLAPDFKQSALPVWVSGCASEIFETFRQFKTFLTEE